MDIILQYLNVRKQKQAFVKVTGIDCNTIYQAINHRRMDDLTITFIDYLEKTYNSSFLFVGMIDAQYCNRKALEELSYSDFRRITCGPGETSGID
jgi:hypothetical protein